MAAAATAAGVSVVVKPAWFPTQTCNDFEGDYGRNCLQCNGIDTACNLCLAGNYLSGKVCRKVRCRPVSRLGDQQQAELHALQLQWGVELGRARSGWPAGLAGMHCRHRCMAASLVLSVVGCSGPTSHQRHCAAHCATEAGCSNKAAAHSGLTHGLPAHTLHPAPRSLCSALTPCACTAARWTSPATAAWASSSRTRIRTPTPASPPTKTGWASAAR